MTPTCLSPASASGRSTPGVGQYSSAQVGQYSSSQPQHVASFLLRYGRSHDGKASWPGRHKRWLDGQRFTERGAGVGGAH
jgi:hypothetical protein